MKLSKREIISLSILGLVIVSIGLYKFIIAPQRESLKTLKVQRDLKKSQLSKLETEIASEGKLYVDLLKLEDEVGTKARKFFTTTTQEDIILLITELLKENKLKASSITFPETRLETIRESEEEGQNQDDEENSEEDKDDDQEITLKVYSADIEYEGHYYSLVDFLNAVQKYDKKIIVKNIGTSKEEDGYLRGKIVLDFYTIGNIIDIGEELYTWSPNMGSIVGNPFIEFDEYTAQKNAKNEAEEQKKQQEEQAKENASDEQPIIQIIETPNTSDSGISEESIISNIMGKIKDLLGKDEEKKPDKEPELVKEVVFGFEDMESVSFSGSNEDIKGKLALNDNSTEGKKSLKLEYEFAEKNKANIANIKFEKSIKIPKKSNKISIDVNPSKDYKDTNLGIIITDKKGKDYYTVMSLGLNKAGWNTLRADLDENIAYPAIIKTIYIEGPEQPKELKRSMLLDKLEIETIK